MSTAAEGGPPLDAARKAAPPKAEGPVSLPLGSVRESGGTVALKRRVALFYAIY